MPNNTLAKAILADRRQLEKAVKLFRSEDDPGNDERFAAIDVIRIHLNRERDAVRELGKEPKGWATVDKIDNWTYEIETMLHDFSDPVYKDAIDGMTTAIERHLDWDVDVLVPLVEKLPDDTAERIARVGDE